MQFPYLASKFRTNQPHATLPEKGKLKRRRGLRCMINAPDTEMHDKIGRGRAHLAPELRYMKLKRYWNQLIWIHWKARRKRFEAKVMGCLIQIRVPAESPARNEQVDSFSGYNDDSDSKDSKEEVTVRKRCWVWCAGPGLEK